MPEDPTQSGTPRFPWGEFPPVLRNANIGTLKQAPEYPAAKAGDALAALDLADRVITAEFVESVRNLGGTSAKPVLLPVLAEESAGRNKIPEAFARILEYRLGWADEENILQITRAYRTDSGADQRRNRFKPLSSDRSTRPGRHSASGPCYFLKYPTTPGGFHRGFRRTSQTSSTYSNYRRSHQ